MEQKQINRKFVKRLKKLQKEKGKKAVKKEISRQIQINIKEKSTRKWCKKTLNYKNQFDENSDEITFCINISNIKNESQLEKEILKILEKKGITSIEQVELEDGLDDDLITNENVDENVDGDVGMTIGGGVGSSVFTQNVAEIPSSVSTQIVAYGDKLTTVKSSNSIVGGGWGNIESGKIMWDYTDNRYSLSVPSDNLNTYTHKQCQDLCAGDRLCDGITTRMEYHRGKICAGRSLDEGWYFTGRKSFKVAFEECSALSGCNGITIQHYNTKKQVTYYVRNCDQNFTHTWSSGHVGWNWWKSWRRKCYLGISPFKRKTTTTWQYNYLDTKTGYGKGYSPYWAQKVIKRQCYYSHRSNFTVPKHGSTTGFMLPELVRWKIRQKSLNDLKTNGVDKKWCYIKCIDDNDYRDDEYLSSSDITCNNGLCGKDHTDLFTLGHCICNEDYDPVSGGYTGYNAGSYAYYGLSWPQTCQKI